MAPKPMAMRLGAPSLSLPVSPTKQTNVLPNIPEVMPGPNAFAIEKARRDLEMENYRLAGNAFYQAEKQRRLATPPTVVHPALRHTTKTKQQDTQSREPSASEVRSSQVTTRSPFLAADKSQSSSPKVRLVPRGHENAKPTDRAYIEESREQKEWKVTNPGVPRTPVFIESPTLGTSVSKSSSNQIVIKAVDRKPVEKEPLPQPPKSPKRKLRNLFHISNLISSSAVTALPTTSTEGSLPAKAAAVLGSPSPKKNFSFSLRSRYSDKTHPITSKQGIPRDPADFEVIPDTAAPPAFTLTSDPTKGNEERSPVRVISNPLPGDPIAEKICQAFALARSQSLHHIDQSRPPTPLPKDTPPQLKAKLAVLNNATPHHSPDRRTQDRPVSKDQNANPSAEDVDPFKFYGLSQQPVNETPTKVSTIIPREGALSSKTFAGHAKPIQSEVTRSKSSVHRSAAPRNNHIAYAVKDSRWTKEEQAQLYKVQGLLENGYLPESYYSPSVYSDTGDTRPNTILGSSKFQHTITPLLPARPSAPAVHLQQPSSSSGGSIPVFYKSSTTFPPRSTSKPATMLSPTNSLANVQATNAESTSGAGDANNTGPDGINGCVGLGVQYRPISSVTASPDALAAAFGHTLRDSAEGYTNPSAVPSPLHNAPDWTVARLNGFELHEPEESAETQEQNRILHVETRELIQESVKARISAAMYVHTEPDRSDPSLTSPLSERLEASFIKQIDACCERLETILGMNLEAIEAALGILSDNVVLVHTNVTNFIRDFPRMIDQVMFLQNATQAVCDQVLAQLRRGNANDVRHLNVGIEGIRRNNMQAQQNISDLRAAVDGMATQMRDRHAIAEPTTSSSPNNGGGGGGGGGNTTHPSSQRRSSARSSLATPLSAQTVEASKLDELLSLNRSLLARVEDLERAAQSSPKKSSSHHGSPKRSA
ncbi:hypothetical protein LTR50_006716 [Elasticomyces elasticus]|nr:hypothetical protein LTR50_006716 [Elasticomyces elasticus]